MNRKIGILVLANGAIVYSGLSNITRKPISTNKDSGPSEGRSTGRAFQRKVSAKRIAIHHIPLPHQGSRPRMVTDQTTLKGGRTGPSSIAIPSQEDGETPVGSQTPWTPKRKNPKLRSARKDISLTDRSVVSIMLAHQPTKEGRDTRIKCTSLPPQINGNTCILRDY